MRNFLIIPVMILACGILGCASSGQVQKLESTSETNARLLGESEQRLRHLEASVSSLNSQVAQLNNRVYEVRNRNGQKTSLTVVPLIPPAAMTMAHTTGSTPVAQVTPPNSRAEALLAQARKAAAERNRITPEGTSSPAAATQQAAPTPAPQGKMIDPAAAPAPLPSPTANLRAVRPQVPAQRTAGATGSLGQPETIAGPSGTLSAQRTDVPAALPPVDLPSPTQAPTATSAGANSTTVPVPAIPASSLALPPEHPDLPPVGQPQTTTPEAGRQSMATPAPAVASASRAASPRGEEAAYKAALNATLAGKTTEGIRLFHDFLQEYPHGRYAANADYWIGECLYAQGKYQDALAQFQKVNDTYPQHHKNADALLKAGMTMSRLGDKAAAAEKYRALMAQFPNSDAAHRARAMGVAR